MQLLMFLILIRHKLLHTCGQLEKQIKINHFIGTGKHLIGGVFCDVVRGRHIEMTTFEIAVGGQRNVHCHMYSCNSKLILKTSHLIHAMHAHQVTAS